MSERPPSSDRLRRMASDDERAISEARSEQMTARAIARVQANRSVGHRLGAAVVGASLILFMVVALGLTSARSLPGDPLYGVSRAYEEVGGWVGVGDSVESRLNEAIALAERGDGVLAAQAAAEALDELERTTDFVLMIPTTTTVPDSSDDGSPTPTTPINPPVSAAPEGSDDQSVESLKLAAQLLLNSVKNNGGELDSAAVELARAVDGVVEEVDPVVPEETSTTTSTSTTVPDSTTTTEPEDTSTTTSVPDSTTTVPEEEDGEVDDGPGPIFIPPQP